jgi:non-ribosomal peptide synthetase-like protein
VAQVLMVLAYAAVQLWPMLAGLDWLLAETRPLAAFGRAIVLGAALWAQVVLMPVLVKWLLIGRWTPREIPAWSLAYLRFWAVRQVMRFNPIVVFAGSPLYNAYLRLLGARVGPGALVSTPTLPICTDLITIGEDSVISRHVLLNGYRIEAGWVRTGPVTVGRGCFVGESTVLDIDTEMADGSQIGHSSALLPGQRLAAGQRAHGSPAQPTGTDYRRVPDGVRPGRWRIGLFTLAQLALLLLVSLPVPLWALHLLGSEEGQRMEQIFDLHLLGHAHPAHWEDLDEAALIGGGLLLGGTVVWALVMMLLPRLLGWTLTPGRVYPLYGLHYLLLQWMAAWSNSKFHNTLAGDSRYATTWLQAIGYRMPDLEQTGSNFGLSQVHDVPTLCTFGRGTMVSDGLIISNADLSVGQFRVGAAQIGARNFIGNNVLFPAGSRTGDNCLLATRTMVPIDGPLRENVGLLGSPCFEIPRSVLRDRPDPRLQDPVWRTEALRRKSRSNGLTIGLYLASQTAASALALVIVYTAYVGIPLPGALSLAIGAVAAMVVQVLWHILVDRATLGGQSLVPRTDLILEPAFWRHERFWKLGLSGDHALMVALRGTPFSGVVWRALGVRVGRQLLDDGAMIPEKTLTALGDHATLGELAVIQGHSLEDGLFKSDKIRLGDDVTLGARAFVHYGVEVADRVLLDTDTFLMKGEQPAAGSRWHGNPGQPGAALPAGRSLSS